MSYNDINLQSYTSWKNLLNIFMSLLNIEHSPVNSFLYLDLLDFQAFPKTKIWIVSGMIVSLNWSLVKKFTNAFASCNLLYKYHMKINDVLVTCVLGPMILETLYCSFRMKTCSSKECSLKSQQKTIAVYTIQNTYLKKIIYISSTKDL